MALTPAERQAKYAEKHGTSKVRQLADGRWVWHSTTRGPIYAPTETALKKKMSPPKSKWLKGILRRQKANTAALNLARDNVDQWTKDWFTKNLNKFGIRDLNKALDQLEKDWSGELKANPAKYTHAQFTGFTETGFPKIRGATKIQGTGTAKKIVPNPKAFKFPGVGSMDSRGGDEYHRPFFKKVFYANYLKNNPSFRKDVKNYMEHILENKSGQVNQHNAKAFREFGEKIAKPDVIHFLSPDAGINTVSRSKLLGTAFPGLYQKFQKKVNKASVRYTENLKMVERKLKMPIGSIRKGLKAEHEALAKIFDVSELPQSLQYSVDHQFGIAEAARSKNLKFVQATVDNLRGMTNAMNEGLGWGGFNVRRKFLIDKINAGQEATKNLEDLNKLTKAAYNVEGAYQLSPENKVVPAAHFVGETQPERFGSFFKEIAKTKEGSATIKKQYGSLNNLLGKLVADGAAGGGSCDLALVKAVRSGNAPGGVIGPDCSAQIKQVIQENPDQLIKEAAEAKVKPGQSTGFRNIARQILNKIPKGGRLGAILAGAGAVGAGTYAMMGGAKAEEPPTTEQMTYNSTTGEFDNAEGDPETQEGILNWIADNPIKSGLAPIPIGIGAGLGADAMNARNVGSFFKSMKFILPPAYAAEKLHQYKRGDDMGQMFANPIDAVWAMALDTPTSARDKWNYYKNIAQKRAGTTGAVSKAAVEAEKLGLRHLDPRKFKETGAALKRATMAPRSFGTSLVFPFAGPKAGAGTAMKVFRGAARLAPLGPLPMALLAGSMAWDKYKFNKKVGDHVDALRAKGVVSEDDAQSMNTIYKQGWLGTTAIGSKILGSEELMLDGEMADIEKQKEVLAKMKEFYEGREDVAAQERAGERQEDFFDWFSKGGRVGLAEGGNKPPFGMTRRSFLKWLIGSIVTGVAAVSGKGLKQAAKTATATVAKTPAKFIGVEGMPLWFPRAVAKIKTHGKLLELADKHYTQGDMYEMMIPVKIKRSLSGRKGHTETVMEQRKVVMEDNPLTGEIDMQWTGTDNFGGDAVRHISFKPGSSGYQKFGVDDPEAAARGVREYQRVKVEEPEFSYTQPDQSQPMRDDIEYLDIFEEGDEIVKGLEDMTGSKQMVTKDGTVIDVSAEGKLVDKEFQKKIYKDIEGEGQLIPEPEGTGLSQKGDVYGEEQFQEIIGGEIPEHLKKKAEGGIIETGNIARRPGAVPPLSGPDPQGQGIVGLFSSPKRVNIT